jgi:hypothetical protein
MAARSARRNTVHHGAGAQAEDFTEEFLRMKNDPIQSKVVVAYDDPSRLVISELFNLWLELAVDAHHF